ncbi:MAG TPA: hypothetical protein VHK27_14405 [Gammaproteobacteria bacterium]|nr:hypothetical protein [Gammaproteobacteria bacterium]
MSKTGWTVDQRIRPGLRQLGIKISHESSWKAFYSLLTSNRNSGGKKKITERWTMNDCPAGVLVISIVVMIVCVYRNRRAVIHFGFIRNSLAILPSRGNPGEEYQQTTSDKDRAFHCGS